MAHPRLAALGSLGWTIHMRLMAWTSACISVSGPVAQAMVAVGDGGRKQPRFDRTVGPGAQLPGREGVSGYDRESSSRPWGKPAFVRRTPLREDRAVGRSCLAADAQQALPSPPALRTILRRTR